MPRYCWAENLSLPSLLKEPARKNLFLNSATGATQTITVVSGRNYFVSFSGTGTITFSGGATGSLVGTGASARDRVALLVTTSSTSVTCTITGTVEYVNFEINTNDTSVTYPTSWIPTGGAIETRNEDVIISGNIASLIGQTEGTIFIEARTFVGAGSNYIALNDGTTNNRIEIGFLEGTSNVRFISFNPSAEWSITGGTTPVSYSKLAGSYALNNIKFYQNANSLGTDTSATIAECTTLTLQPVLGSFFGRIRLIVLFRNSMTDAQLIELTTP
jgi:hypothetical protein